MRILVVSNLYPPNVLGGYEVGCADVVAALRARGHDVTVLTSRSRHDFTVDDPPWIKRELTLWDLFQTERFGNAFASVNAFQGKALDPDNLSILLHELADGAYDVVYCFNLLGLGALAICDTLTRLGAAWAWHIMDSIPTQVVGGLRPEIVALFETASRRAFLPGRSFVMSNRLLREIEAGNVSVGRLGDTCTIVPGWAKQPPAAAAEPPRDGKVRFVSVGVLGREKGTDLTIAALGALPAGLRDRIEVDFLGRGDLPSYQRKATQAGVAGCVRFHGQLPHAEVMRRLPSYDALLFPTWAREPFGFVALEAAISGVLPIITRGIGAAEVLRDGEHAIHIERSEASLAAAVIQVVQNRSRCAALAGNAKRHVTAGYTLDAIVDQIEAELASIATGASVDARTAARFDTINRFKYRIGRELVTSTGLARQGHLQEASMAISESYTELKRAGRAASKSPVVKFARSALMKLLRPYFERLLLEMEAQRDEVVSLRQQVGVKTASTPAETPEREAETSHTAQR
ncbi:glycosyltransferase family 4 protein [Rhodoplanes roseus]|uniref:Glycosyl transferase family 1 domain-containing protein n=1 Tax=Rhodoplanes roseus TaxID=29409 RepID=A0A327KYN1_9BRAD|nr:glycosyltransferase family 4 protein [Rhodoplanes roseus]RAI43196.1 hypothetical protein CH341_15620 [Rhodoplanes roseus]